MALALLGGLAHNRSDLVLARQHYEEAIAYAREAGHPHFIAMYAHTLAGVATDEGDHAGAAALSDEALSLWRARGDTWAIGNALKNLGKAARVLGDIPRGAAAYREAVTLVAKHDDRGQVAECLEGLAHLATVGGAPERAARLFGAAEALYETTGVQMPVFDPNAYEPTLAAIRTAVDETTVAERWAAGRALSFEQAVAEAKDVANCLAGNQN
jgi:tetratricopeptide (TPR) repeat protein